MCINIEWMYCVIHGTAGVGNGEIIFTLAPSALNMNDFNSRKGYYVEDDIYFLEVCTITEMCSNGDEIFHLKVGDKWRCQFDPASWAKSRDEWEELRRRRTLSYEENATRPSKQTKIK